MPENTHRIHIRMTKEQYERLNQKSRNAGMPMNKYLVHELVIKRPLCIPIEETAALIKFTNEIGREINHVAHAFNAEYGTADQLRYAVKRLAEIVERAVEVNLLKNRRTKEWIEEVGYERQGEI